MFSNVENEVEAPPVWMSSTWKWISEGFKKDADKVTRKEEKASKRSSSTTDLSDKNLEEKHIDAQRAETKEEKK